MTQDLLSAIEFQDARELLKTVQWCHDPDKSIATSSAVRHIHAEQFSNNTLRLTARLTGNTWVSRKVRAQGVVGTEYLIDGEDLLTRLKGDVWKNSPIRISKTPSNVVSVECKTASGTTGNIEVACYGGDMADFQPVERDWEVLGTIHDTVGFKTSMMLANDFSGLRQDTTERPVWLFCREGSLTTVVTERNGDRGLCYLRHRCGATFGTRESIGIQGRQAIRVASVQDEAGGIITISRSLDGEFLRFEGSAGWVTTPSVDPYRCQALSRGASGYFWDEGFTTRSKATRVFRLQELKDAVDIQTPKKGANRNDLLLEFQEESCLTISKRCDIRRRETSNCMVANSAGIVTQWEPCTVDHSYCTDALMALSRYFNSLEKASGSEPLDFFDEEKEGQESHAVGSLMVVQQRYCDEFKVGFLSLKPAGAPDTDVEVILMTQTMAATQDYNESD